MSIEDRDYYFDGVDLLATSIIATAKAHEDFDGDVLEIISYDGLAHEAVDSDIWISYHGYHSEVCLYSNNEKAYREVYDNESLGELVFREGIEATYGMIAFYALLADVQHRIYELVGEAE